MKSLNELIDVAQDEVPPAPPPKPRITVVIVLSMLLGVLLTFIAVGALFHRQTSRALEAQVLAVEEELKAKSLALVEMKTQIAMLSKHIQILKEYAIARSVSVSEGVKKSAGPAPVSTPDSAGRAVGPSDAGRGAPSPPRAKASPNCELAGKSPEQQALVVQRCVGLAEVPRENPGKK